MFIVSYYLLFINIFLYPISIYYGKININELPVTDMASPISGGTLAKFDRKDVI